jgi:hypothetical protein
LENRADDFALTKGLPEARIDFDSSPFRRKAAQRLCCVYQEIQNDMLDMDSVPVRGRQILLNIEDDRDAARRQLGPPERQHLVEQLSSGERFRRKIATLEQRPHSIDDCTGAKVVLPDICQDCTHLGQVERFLIVPGARGLFVRRAIIPRWRAWAEPRTSIRESRT